MKWGEMPGIPCNSGRENAVGMVSGLASWAPVLPCSSLAVPQDDLSSLLCLNCPSARWGWRSWHSRQS